MKVNSRLQIAQCLIHQNCTINCNFEAPKTGYMVSRAGGLELSDPNLDDILVFVRENYKEVENNQFLYFGAWTEDGVKYIDVSWNIQDLNEAVFIGKQEKQLAIWSMENNCAIWL